MQNSRFDKDSSISKIMFVLGIVFSFAMAVVGNYTLFTIHKLNVLPKRYMIIVIIAFIVVTAIVSIMNKWFIPGIFAKIISIILIIVMIIGCKYMNYTYDKVSDIMNVDTTYDDMNCYVMKDDIAQDINDAKMYTFGMLRALDRENTDRYVADIEYKLGSGISFAEYDTVVELAKALYEGDVDSIIMNGAYEGIIMDVEDYASFDTDTRIIDYLVIESEVGNNGINKDYLYNGDEVFTVYISGIDARQGTPKNNSNSDVNILLTVNMNTHQILLISTPRDFYVPLSISGGAKDKLTHAGGYGIDVSMDTMEMLYGVNIDNYMKINFTGFVKVVDALGGIEVYSDYEFSQGEYSYNKGINKLDGENALMFARCRYAFKDGDRQRGKNQMAVIEAIIQKMSSKDALRNYTETLDYVSDCMITSMDYNQITDMVKYQLDTGEGWDVQKYSVNGFDSSNTTYSSGSQVLYVMEPDQATVDQAREYLKQIYSNQRINVR